MTLTSACVRALPCLPFVALWLALPCALTERAALVVCRAVYPRRSL